MIGVKLVEGTSQILGTREGGKSDSYHLSSLHNYYITLIGGCGNKMVAVHWK